MNGYFLIYVFNIGFNDLWCFSLYKKNKTAAFFKTPFPLLNASSTALFKAVSKQYTEVN